MSPTPAKSATPPSSTYELSPAMSRRTILLIIIGLLIFIVAICTFCSIKARRGIKQGRTPNNNHRSTRQARRRPITRIVCSVASGHAQHTHARVSPASDATPSSPIWSLDVPFYRTNSAEPLLLHNATPQLSLWGKFLRFLQGGTRRRLQRSNHHTLRPVDTSSVNTRRVDTDTTIGGESVMLPPPTYDGFSPVQSRSYYADIRGSNTTHSVRHEQEPLEGANILPNDSPANATTTTTTPPPPTTTTAPPPTAADSNTRNVLTHATHL